MEDKKDAAASPQKKSEDTRNIDSPLRHVLEPQFPHSTSTQIPPTTVATPTASPNSPPSAAVISSPPPLPPTLSLSAALTTEHDYSKPSQPDSAPDHPSITWTNGRKRMRAEIGEAGLCVGGASEDPIQEGKRVRRQSVKARALQEAAKAKVNTQNIMGQRSPAS